MEECSKDNLSWLLKTITFDDLEEDIIAILGRGKPVPISVISFILGVPGWKVQKKLKQMQKWRTVVPITRQTETFWAKS